MKRFVSKFRNLKVWIKQPTVKVVNGQVIEEPGEFIQFQNGFYETDNKAEIDAIRKYAGDVVVEVDVDKKDANPEALSSTYFKTTEQLAAEAAANEEGSRSELVEEVTGENDDLESLSKEQIVEIAKAKGIRVGKLGKKQLIELIRQGNDEETPQF